MTAFDIVAEYVPPSQEKPEATTETKTLRDEFAMAAMAAIISSPVCDCTPVEMAKTAYANADAMLAERVKGKGAVMSDKPKFTPGPWRWSNDYQSRDGDKTWSLIGENGYGVLSCDGEANSPQKLRPFDANLIAAAPELYDMLASIENDDGKIPAWLWERIQNTLKKARGE